MTRSELLTIFKIFEAVESSISFMVGVYSLEIAGFLDGYKALKLTTLIIRSLSVGSSLLTLPLGIFNLSLKSISDSTVKVRQEKALKWQLHGIFFEDA